MAREEISLQNFVGGEQAENMYGRFDLAAFRNGCRRLKNFIIEPQGSVVYRPGFQVVNHTRRHNIANLIRFEFNDEQAYVLEFTDGKLRFFRNNASITETSVALHGSTAITNANPAVVTTAASHGYEDGDEVFLEDLTGMPRLNNRSFVVANKTATTFELTDSFGANINTTDTTKWGTHTGGTGVAKRIYEIDTPFTEASDLFLLSTSQNADVMYIAHPDFLPRKLTRTDHASWTLENYTRTTDPFTIDGAGTIVSVSSITKADPAHVVTSAAHGLSDGDIVVVHKSTTMLEVNDLHLKVANKTATEFDLHNLDDTNFDSSAFATAATDGEVTLRNVIPRTVTFYESRLWFASTRQDPDLIFASRAPDDNGASRYDDFTVGIDADHSLRIRLADGKVNKIFWLSGTDRLLLAGTLGTETKLTGDEGDRAITPTSIKARAISRFGVDPVFPINEENIVFYIQRGGLGVKSFEFDALQDKFIAADRNLIASHITESGMKQLTWQSNRPDVMWGVRNDGVMTGLTFQSGEAISGWHRHTTGTDDEDKFLSATSLPRPTNYDQLWVATERTFNSVTQRFVEYSNDHPVYPNRDDFFTGEDNEAADQAKFDRRMRQVQKEYIHLDCALTFSGLNTTTTLKPGADSGTGITFTAGAATFASTDVGKHLKRLSADGSKFGEAVITGFTSTTVVTADIVENFDSDTIIPASEWYLTTNSLTNLDHLEGRSVSIVADGSNHPKETVTDGAITLDYQAAVVHVGIAYEGLVKPMTLEFGGDSGPAQSKPKNVAHVGFRFLNTIGVEFGTNLYKPEQIRFSTMPLPIGVPVLPFTGVMKVPYSRDEWERDKSVFTRQLVPLPATVQMLVIYGDTDNN